MLTKVAIIGRANVGKSTLFNRLAEKRSALVSGIAGTTRDLKKTIINWQGKEFELIDSGGFLAGPKTPIRNLTKKENKKLKIKATDDIDKQVEVKARLALKESQTILLVTDAKEGLNPQDREIAGYLRKEKNKKIILVVNKCDSQQIRLNTAEFHKLGLSEPVLVSAINGSGTGDLLDAISQKIKQTKEEGKEKIETDPIKVAIIGKPNVGKSSILNKLVGYERAIVSDTPHTTREPNDELIEYKDNKILLLDTAGIRKKAKIAADGLEKMGVKMSIGALKKSRVALLILDINQSISHQDLELGKLIIQAGVGVIMVANKYDLIKQTENTKLQNEYSQNIYRNFPHLKFAPLIFTSAKTGSNIQKILELILEVDKQNKIKIADNALARFLKTIIRYQPPAKKKIKLGKKTIAKRSFITNFRQIDSNPPLFECLIGAKEKLPEEYKKYIINKLREKFLFKGVPIRLIVRHKNLKNKERI